MNFRNRILNLLDFICNCIEGYYDGLLLVDEYGNISYYAGATGQINNMKASIEALGGLNGGAGLGGLNDMLSQAGAKITEFAGKANGEGVTSSNNLKNALNQLGSASTSNGGKLTDLGGKANDAGSKFDSAKGKADSLKSAIDNVGSAASGAGGKISSLASQMNAIVSAAVI